MTVPLGEMPAKRHFVLGRKPRFALYETGLLDLIRGISEESCAVPRKDSGCRLRNGEDTNGILGGVLYEVV